MGSFLPAARNVAELDLHQDPHEFFHGLVNACTNSILDAHRLNAHTAPEECKEKTFFFSQFGGKLFSYITCDKCGGNKSSNKRRMSERIESFKDLSLGIDGVRSLQDALNAFTKVEDLNDYTCESCGSYGIAKKRCSIWENPKVLTLHFKRFNASRRKINNHVSFETKLDLSSILTSTLEGDTEEIARTLSIPRTTTTTSSAVYKLFAVLVHIGESMHNGHIVTYVKQRNGCWYKTDDERVTRVEEVEVLRQQAYMVFYTLCGDDIDDDTDDADDVKKSSLSMPFRASARSAEQANPSVAKKLENFQMKNAVATVSTKNLPVVRNAEISRQKRASVAITNRSKAKKAGKEKLMSKSALTMAIPNGEKGAKKKFVDREESFGEANKRSCVDEEEEELDEYDNGIINDDVDRDELLIQAKLEKELLGDIVETYDDGSDNDYGSDDDDEDEVEEKVEVKKKVDNVQEANVSVKWIDDDEDKDIDKPDVAEENSRQNPSRPSRNKKKNEISILDYVEEEMKCPKFTEKFFGDANKSEIETMEMTERLEWLCIDKKEEFIDHIKKDVASDRAENGAKNIAFGTIGDVPLEMRTEVTDTFATGFGILSGKDRERVVDEVDAKVTKRFGDVVADINSACASNAAVSRANIESLKISENFVSCQTEISKVLQNLSVEFDGTYEDLRVHEATQAFKEEYRRISKRGGPPACASGNVFCIIYGPAEEVFEEVQPFKTIRMDTGVYNVMPLDVLIEQLSYAFEKATQKGKTILLKKIFDCSTYPVATIAEETNDAEIQKLLEDFEKYVNQNSKGKTFAVPLRPDFSIFKERHQSSKCLENPVADHVKCLNKWFQHTVKNMEEVGREIFTATLTPQEQQDFVIIELHVDLTRCRAPGSHDFEELIKKYTKREIRLNLKRTMDLATNFHFKLVFSSRWVFKRLVKYLRNAESTIGREYAAADGEVTDLLDSENIGLCVATEEDAAGGAVLASTLEAARGRIFHVAAVKKAVTSEQKTTLEVYNHYHLSQALRSGGNTNMFAISVVKLIAAYGLSLLEAIRRARGTYYFNNLLARSVVLKCIQDVKMSDEDLQKAGRLAYHDVSFFVNPDAFRRLVCVLHFHLQKVNGVLVELVDASNDAEQFKAWKTFIKEGSDARAVMMTHWNCSLSRFLGIFASATFECFNRSLGGGGKFNNQYDFRDPESIAFLVWRKNLTHALWDHLIERTNVLDDDDELFDEAKEGKILILEDERLREKLKLAKYAAEKRKNAKQNGEGGTFSTSKTTGKRAQHPKFPLRDVDRAYLANRISAAKKKNAKEQKPNTTQTSRKKVTKEVDEQVKEVLEAIRPLIAHVEACNKEAKELGANGSHIKYELSVNATNPKEELLALEQYAKISEADQGPEKKEHRKYLKAVRSLLEKDEYFTAENVGYPMNTSIYSGKRPGYAKVLAALFNEELGYNQFHSEGVRNMIKIKRSYNKLGEDELEEALKNVKRVQNRVFKFSIQTINQESNQKGTARCQLLKWKLEKFSKG